MTKKKDFEFSILGGTIGTFILILILLLANFIIGSNWKQDQEWKACNDFCKIQENKCSAKNLATSDITYCQTYGNQIYPIECEQGIVFWQDLKCKII